MSSTGSLTRDTYLGIGTTLLVVCSVFVSVRCFLTLRTRKKLLLDDYFAILGLLFIAVAFGLNDVIIKKFVDPTSSFDTLSEYGIVITIILGFAAWTSKVPIFLVIVKVFGIRRWLRLVCYWGIGITGVGIFVGMIPTFAWCRPYRGVITVPDFLECVRGTALSGVISSCIGTAADILVFLLPIHPLYELQLPRNKKVALSVVFCSGILGIVASVVSLYYKVQTYQGKQSETLVAMLCVVIECTIAIMVSCAPAVKGFWSVFITQTTGATIKPSSGYPSHGSKSRSAGERGIAVTSDTYIIMESRNPSFQRDQDHDIEGYELGSQHPVDGQPPRDARYNSSVGDQRW